MTLKQKKIKNILCDGNKKRKMPHNLSPIKINAKKK